MSRRHVITTAGFGALLLAVALVRPAHAVDTVVYYHTDALHSVTVVTNAQGQVIERTHYAPYGQVLNRPLRDGPGYAGHREDAATGLVYMQQRYYDPESGRFLSADPVGVDPASGGNFNRYWYANDNPYRYTDPDGRYTCSGSKTQCGTIQTALKDVAKAAANLKAGSSGQQRLNAVTQLFGKEGVDNGVKVAFGKVDGALANTDTKGQKVTITMNLSAMRRVFSGRNDGSTARSEIAGAVAHEGTHGIDGRDRGGMNPQNTGQERETERHAFAAQAAAAQGLGVNSAYGLWNTGWPSSQADSLRDKAVESNAEAATKLWSSCAYGGGC